MRDDIRDGKHIAVKNHFAQYLEHTLLLPEATPKDIEILCEEAVTHRLHGVCVNPSYVKLAAEFLRHDPMGVCTVIGFPLGATLPDVKLTEAMRALLHGARELDLVLHLGRLRCGDYQYVEREIYMIAETVHKHQNARLKVIIETGILTDNEKMMACRLAQKAGADMIKTSTGFRGGATLHDVRLIRAVIGPDMGIKASGGIGSYLEAKSLIDAGATRIGTSKALAILDGVPTPEEGGY